MKWTKKGLIFRPSVDSSWMNSYASPTTVLHLPDRYRIYFTTRESHPDNNFISRATFLEVDRADPRKVLYIHDKPILPLGSRGHFDEFGTMVAEVVRLSEREVFLYYMGWQRGVSVPYYVTIGLSVSQDGGIGFEKPWLGPIFGITKDDPLSIGNVTIRRQEQRWHMWYTSYTAWAMGGGTGKPSPGYYIKYADSNDGINWTGGSRNCLTPTHPGEAIATPSVLKIGERYHMWFSYRGSSDYYDGSDSYRIGYAHSQDGRDWARDDAFGGLEASENGWDSKMTAYPCVIHDGDRLVMLYNGNFFGREGFGFAESRDLCQPSA